MPLLFFSMDSGIHLGYPLLDTEVKVCDVNGEKIITEGIGRIFLGRIIAFVSTYSINVIL